MQIHRFLAALHTLQLIVSANCASGSFYSYPPPPPPSSSSHHPKPHAVYRPPIHPLNGQMTPLKPLPNAPSVKQWETRTWISTIPLSSPDNNRETYTPPPSSASDHHHHNDNYNYPKYSSKVSEYSYRTYGTNPYGPLSNGSYPLRVGSVQGVKICRDGENCRKSPFQGTYDTINYQKRFIYPEKQTAHHGDYSYSNNHRYRSPASEEDDYDHKGSLQWTHHHAGRYDDHPRGKSSYYHQDQPNRPYTKPIGKRLPNHKSYNSGHEGWYDNDRPSKTSTYPKNGYEYNDYDREKDWRGTSSYSSEHPNNSNDYTNEKDDNKPKAKRNRPKIREFHHDDDNPDGYSHAHGYEKEEEEGTRFFEPSGLDAYEDYSSPGRAIKQNLDIYSKTSPKGKECDCSRRYSHHSDISRPNAKKYESNEENDHVVPVNYRSDNPTNGNDNSGEYSASIERKTVPESLTTDKSILNDTQIV